MDINRLKAYCLLYESGGFQEASRRSKSNPTSIRSKVVLLEKELRTKLIETSGQRVVFTAAGHRFHKEALQIIDFATARLDSFKLEQEGFNDKIIIATTHAIASLWLPAVLPRFRVNFPKTAIILKSSDEQFNLYQREADVSIAAFDHSKPQEDNLSHLLLTNYYMNLYASEEYLNQYGTPATIEDLQQHTIISFGKDIPYPYPSINWHLEFLPSNFIPLVQVNSGAAILRTVQNDLGIGSISQKGAETSNKKLVRILPSFLTGPTLDITYNFPKTRAEEPLIKKLYEILKISFE
ncbi:MAG: LysR family transcriptional regulator [Candidatus Paracaedimonas acanthamoebae]|uniref:LysR family transcriptional regulator n=1 Tax=Candidatus Paracaedimonas acanthamoebae TaxID=244581 RepID=A0A8J7PJZ8_9PROT|nr:LysR family transcriptional regulator [Candidatus Paracaedimonas acanthamoebae]